MVVTGVNKGYLRVDPNPDAVIVEHLPQRTRPRRYARVGCSSEVKLVRKGASYHRSFNVLVLLVVITLNVVVYRVTNWASVSFTKVGGKKIEVVAVDGHIFPNINRDESWKKIIVVETSRSGIFYRNWHPS